MSLFFVFPHVFSSFLLFFSFFLRWVIKQVLNLRVKFWTAECLLSVPGLIFWITGVHQFPETRIVITWPRRTAWMRHAQGSDTHQRILWSLVKYFCSLCWSLVQHTLIDPNYLVVSLLKHSSSQLHLAAYDIDATGCGGDELWWGTAWLGIGRAVGIQGYRPE